MEIAYSGKVDLQVSEKAAEVFDTLGSSMANLNPGSAFLTGASAKNNELSILAFEVANTIVKGSNIMQGLSRRSIKLLKEVILPSEGVQNLVSANMDELLKIVATDKRLLSIFWMFLYYLVFKNIASN